uniref:GPI ethanolamine phosphate transferase 2 n=1 Tax=Ascaris lumbricoides TaxID=6252 RepID=A0A9J2PV35_ASCLU
MVIDAWRAGFYFDSITCKMPFLCALQNSGQAFAFEAHVQTPTVTMPRIKAFTAGTVPSFGDVVLNFASNEISEDNIVDRLKHAGLRIMFCGDDTWFRLFPKRFENGSEGTVSFFVSDYTEVDNNVTLCMERKLNKERIQDWDVMILHYLGLDHIGHSLGGNHETLNVKLKEMDSVIKKLHSKMSELVGTGFWMVILGDHGMTEAGGHGGSSMRETSVPLVFIDGAQERANWSTDGVSDPSKPMDSAEQIDLVPTVASLMDIAIPVNSIGVNLLPYIFYDFRHQSALRIILSLVQNARHFISFLSSNNEALMSCVERSIGVFHRYCLHGRTLQGENEIVVKTCMKALRLTQEDLLARHTFFNLPLIVSTTLISFMTTIFSLVIVVRKHYPSIIHAFLSIFRLTDYQRGSAKDELPKVLRENISSIFPALLLVLQVAMFFASSLVEEEHDVQYFFFTSCLIVIFAMEVMKLLRKGRLQKLLIRESMLDDKIENRRSAFSQRRWQSSGMQLIVSLMLLWIHRFCRSFTEGMRRRWLFEKQNNDVLTLQQREDTLAAIYNRVTSVGSIFAADISQLLKDSATLCGFANLFAATAMIIFSFILIRNKVTVGLFSISNNLSVGCLIVTFIFTAINRGYYACCVVYVLCITQVLVWRAFGMAVIQWIALIMRPWLFPLISLEILIGLLMRVLHAHPLVFWFAIGSSFFYTGNSNSLSTVDISVGYVCVSYYEPIIVAMQLFINTYSGPLALFFGWKNAAMLCRWEKILWREYENVEMVGGCDYSGSSYSSLQRLRFRCHDRTRSTTSQKDYIPNRSLTMKNEGCEHNSYKHECTSAIYENDDGDRCFVEYICLAVFSRMSACLLSLLIQRHHLFVWSVFAPKFLYESMHLIVISILMIYKCFNSFYKKRIARDFDYC